MARPKGSAKPDHKRRTAQVTFWVTPAERDRISANAERAGVSMSAYIRSLALGKPLRQKPGAMAGELIRQLTRVGNNLNQLLGHAQEGKIHGASHIEHVFRRVSGALKWWTSGEADRKIAQEAITLLAHEGTRLNGLARQANTGEPVSEDQLLSVLNDLTAKLIPFCP
ncbi:plasmid mobilization protein [Phaeobacter gallaeciensis]|uniref:plasmid mobilization protein n=1 Tax=Phaeobacter gallaeciensis TaxID=60890 RepID=UPI00237F77B4|nr:hypothetical protein [Phaeobacter gallaeciensis]MDE4063242.1 hypothetical protein [Phaeobacter gallaeciensis]MDE4126269.1 hypothetical protein [Phaeobacter gallaeciensis]MDE4130681.1 hypothetical protein [Phaeobacter gallaeciensis]